MPDPIRFDIEQQLETKKLPDSKTLLCRGLESFHFHSPWL